MRPRTGTIDPLDDGRYRVRLTVRGRRRTLGIFASRGEAEQIRAAALQTIAEELQDGITLREYGEKWLAQREIGREVRDPESDWGRWRHHVLTDPIADLTLPGIRRRHVLRLRDSLRRRGLARQTILNTLTVLRGVLRHALDDELVRACVADGVKVPTQRRTEDSWTYLQPDEQARLVAEVREPERHIVAVAIATGVRAGELACLRLLDLGADTLTVRYGTPPNLPTKAGKVRRIPILPQCRGPLDAWLAQLPLYAPSNPTGLVFPRARGGFRDPAHILRWDVWTEARQRAVGRTVRWHDLRHTCAASLLRGWWGRRWSLEEVCALLGHASITTTERYAHLADDLLGKAAHATAIGLESVRAAEAALEKKTMISKSAPGPNRTGDLRFRKSTFNDGLSMGWQALDQLATKTLRAVAEGDPHALSMAVDLASAVLDLIRADQVDASGRRA